MLAHYMSYSEPRISGQSIIVTEDICLSPITEKEKKMQQAYQTSVPLPGLCVMIPSHINN